MKALATVALVGLAFGFEDHEFARHGGGHHSKNSTTTKTGKPVDLKSHYPRMPAHDDMDRLYKIYNRPGYRGGELDGDLAPVPMFSPNDRKFNSEMERLEKIFNRPGYNPEIHGLMAPVPMPDFAHMPLMASAPKNVAKKPISADDDDEFFAAEDNELGCFKRNHTQTQKPVQPRLRPNVAPSRHNATQIHHGSHNRTRPFHPVPHHNKTTPKNIVAHDDEEFFAIEDDVLFDLAKLLADASKTVGDVKQNPKNYGELLNDAINIAKDIKRKDDFEDSELRRRA